MTNYEKKIKTIAMIVYMDYVPKADEPELWKAVAAYEGISKKKIDRFKEACVGYVRKLRKEGQDNSNLYHIIDQGRAEEIQRVYIVLNTICETDYFRETAYPKDDSKDEHKSIPERFAEEWHDRDNRIVTPVKWGNLDNTLHWFTSNIGEDVDVVHIDMSVAHPQAFSITEEYFSPIYHDDELTEHEANWATVLGYSGFDRLAVNWLLKQYTEEEMYVFANGGAEPGQTPDKQIVPCPECGEPTWASAASVGYKNYNGDYICRVLDASQMKCSHCGADLSPVFSK